MTLHCLSCHPVLNVNSVSCVCIISICLYFLECFVFVGIDSSLVRGMCVLHMRVD